MYSYEEEVIMIDNRVKVNIFGNTYSIQGDASTEYIHQVADYVGNKMEELSKNTNGNPVQIAILTALYCR